MSDIDVGKRYGNEISREIYESILSDSGIAQIHKEKMRIVTVSAMRYYWINMSTGESKFGFSEEVQKILDKLDELTLARITTIKLSIQKKYGL